MTASQEKTRVVEDRALCSCGKDGTPEAHGYNPQTGHRALTCDEVLELAARVEAGQRPKPRRWLFRRGRS